MMVSRPELVGRFGAVSSTHWLASSTGMAILERGGNAFDAAVAAGFVLQVVEPHSNGLGGDVSILVHEAGAGTTKAICGQGTTPMAATLEEFQRYGLHQLPGSGLLPACVPGAFAAWLRLLGEFGTMPLAPVMDAAIGYAHDGYPIPADAARAIATLAPLFESEWLGSAEVYLAGGVVPRAGARLRNTVLADTMIRILREAEAGSGSREGQLEAARSAFYSGFIAEAIAAFVQHEVLDSTGRRHRGLLTADDLASWLPTVEDTTSLDTEECVVHKPGPWSQGPVFLQQLALLENRGIRDIDLDSAEFVHVLLEAAKIALADREAWYGDPDHGPVPMRELLSVAYTAERRALMGDEAVLPEPGEPDGRRSWVPRPQPDQLDEDLLDAEWMRQLQSGLPTIVLRSTLKSGDTCCVTVVDKAGNLVAAVPSGGWLKSSPIVPGLGFALGTRAQTMVLEAGHPNSLGPRKRPRTTLSPTIVTREGMPYLAFGTPGGDRQDQWTMQTFLAATKFGLDLQTATELPHFHTDHFPSSFTPRSYRRGRAILEGGGSLAIPDDLRRRGHDVEIVPPYSLGSKVCIVGVDAELGFVRAAAGPRGRQAYAICR